MSEWKVIHCHKQDMEEELNKTPYSTAYEIQKLHIHEEDVTMILKKRDGVMIVE